MGLEVRRNHDKEGKPRIQLLQPGLVDKVLNVIKDDKLIPINDSRPQRKPERTPAGSSLGASPDSPPFDEVEFGFSYRQAVGMLSYLLHTRPDLQTAVHQCARFSHAPRAIHGKAIRRIARYLKDTREEGLNLRTHSGPVSFDCYVDADFCGLYGYEDPQDPVSVKSRTGYVFTLGGNPVHWASKLQPTIALSTVEAEYIALSQALREFIVMRRVATEICTVFKVNVGEEGTMKSTVFEDNNGCISLATAKRMNPRTKHIATVFHWFWQYTGPGTGIVLEKIASEIQLVDIFTKCLERESFERIRELLMEW